MKKTAIIAGAALLCLFTASANAQTDTVPSQQPATPETPVVTTNRAANDKYNNWDKSKYAMQPMPEALTTEKIFPVLGTYELTDKDGATSQVTVTLDETSKGTVWINGLPEGTIKAYLRKSPAIYRIPEQKTGDDKTTKTIAEGVVIYDKDANLLNVCIGCAYNEADPATVFLPADQQPLVDQAETKTKVKNGTTKTKTKVTKVKPVHYSGNKLLPETALQTTTPAQ